MPASSPPLCFMLRKLKVVESCTVSAVPPPSARQTVGNGIDSFSRKSPSAGSAGGGGSRLNGCVPLWIPRICWWWSIQAATSRLQLAPLKDRVFCLLFSGPADTCSLLLIFCFSTNKKKRNEKRELLSLAEARLLKQEALSSLNTDKKLRSASVTYVFPIAPGQSSRLINGWIDDRVLCH